MAANTLAAKNAYWRLFREKELFTSTGGIPSQIVEIILNVLLLIKDAEGDIAISTHVDDLVLLLTDLHDTLLLPPLSNPQSIQQLREIAAQWQASREQSQKESSLAENLGAKAVQLQTQCNQLLDVASFLDEMRDGLGKELPLLASLCDRIRGKPPETTAPLSSMKENVTVAIGHWGGWLQEIGQKISTQDERIEIIHTALREARELDKFGAPDSKVQRRIDLLNEEAEREQAWQKQLVDLETQGRDTCNKLRGLLQVFHQAEAGLSDELLSPPSIPAEIIHSDGLAEQEELDAREVTTLESPVDANETEVEHNLLPETLGQPIGLTGNTVLLLSLYEVLPRNDFDKRIPRKGILSLIKAGIDCGILKRFGHHTPHEIMQDECMSKAGDSVLKQFLLYSGHPGGSSSGIYIRSRKPLPWDVDSLFSAAEIDAFQRLIVQRALEQKKKRDTV